MQTQKGNLVLYVFIYSIITSLQNDVILRAQQPDVIFSGEQQFVFGNKHIYLLELSCNGLISHQVFIPGNLFSLMVFQYIADNGSSSISARLS